MNPDLTETQREPVITSPQLRGRNTGLMVLFGLAAVFSVWAGFLWLSSAEAGHWVRRAGYYIIAATFIAWALSATRAIHSVGAIKVWHFIGGWRSTLAAATLTLVALLTTPYEYKVLYDELVIQSTAQSMSHDRVVAAIGRGYEIWGRFQILNDYLDKRPFFYPFLVSLLHDLTGYRAGNAFALNTALMPVLLLLTFGIARRLAGITAGWIALVSLGAFSLLALNATGAGLEMLNLTMVLVVVGSGAWYLEKPSDGTRLSLLILSAVLLANTRYESAIYVATTALVVLEGWRRHGGIQMTPAAVTAPLLLIPYAWHNVYLSGMPALWELREGQEQRFSFEYLATNLEMAKIYFGNFGPGIANSPWLAWAGLVCLISWLARRAWQRRRWGDVSATEWSAVACGLGVLANLGLLLAYYWGDLSDPIVSRLSLPLHALLAILIGATIAWLAKTRYPWIAPAAITTALLVYGTWGLRVNQRMTDFNQVATVQSWQLGVVRELENTNPTTRLIITSQSPLFWFSHGLSSTFHGRVNSRVRLLARHMQWQSFGEVLVMQECAPEGPDGAIVSIPETRLPEAFKLEPVAQTRIGARIHRISRISHIAMDELPPEPIAETES